MAIVCMFSIAIDAKKENQHINVRRDIEKDQQIAPSL